MVEIRAWNYCGFGNPQAVRDLRDMLRREDPHAVFISETKLHENKLDRIKRKCGMRSCFGVSAEGRSGGLMMMWREDIPPKLMSFSKNQFDKEIEWEAEGAQGRITGFYGESNANNRHVSWELLRTLSLQSNKAWMRFGNFNELTWDNKKSEKRLRPKHQMKAFKESVEDSGLTDMGFIGRWYSLKRGRITATLIRERLDRALATEKWYTCFPMGMVKHLTAVVYYHCPLLIDTEGYKGKRRIRRQRRRLFFEAMWTKDNESDDVV
ncbi:uncharacterized protein LOC111300973 [Durio zibethinus]|uniref:Uncharacterized protein LOC111300973 n=1 Tax=Durio zibethinus TaxID=66656 RepID=A0A6P5ZIN8_DURZI|nr:uncharacterized protein LOC111300973 [Durio zibethinus]